MISMAAIWDYTCIYMQKINRLSRQYIYHEMKNYVYK
jgi:hypothetical protein